MQSRAYQCYRNCCQRPWIRRMRACGECLGRTRRFDRHCATCNYWLVSEAPVPASARLPAIVDAWADAGRWGQPDAKLPAPSPTPGLRHSVAPCSPRTDSHLGNWNWTARTLGPAVRLRTAESVLAVVRTGATLAHILPPNVAPLAKGNTGPTGPLIH